MVVGGCDVQICGSHLAKMRQPKVQKYKNKMAVAQWRHLNQPKSGLPLDTFVQIKMSYLII